MENKLKIKTEFYKLALNLFSLNAFRLTCQLTALSRPLP